MSVTQKHKDTYIAVLSVNQQQNVGIIGGHRDFIIVPYRLDFCQVIQININVSTSNCEFFLTGKTYHSQTTCGVGHMLLSNQTLVSFH